MKHSAALRVIMMIKHHYDHYTLRRLLDQTHSSGLFCDAHKIVAELLNGRRDVREDDEGFHEIEKPPGETEVQLSLLRVC